jgi:hypothetical protein
VPGFLPNRRWYGSHVAVHARTGARPVAEETPANHWREHVPGLLTVCGVAGLVALFFLGLYAARHYGMPIGWDTPRYLDQTVFIAHRGLDGVPDVLPPPAKTLPSRAAFPLLLLSISSLLRTSTFTVAATIPPAAAVAVALAGGGLASWALRRDRGDLAVVAIVVGLSPQLIRMMAPETYTDNMLALAMVTAALVPLLSAMRDGRGYAAAVALLAVAGIAHGPFFAFMLGVLGLTALAFAPSSIRQWRSGEAGLFSTAAGRLVAIVAGAAAGAAAAIVGFLHAAPDTPVQTRSELTRKFREDVPTYWYPLTIPLAAVGVYDVARGSGASAEDTEGRTRFAARFLLTVAAAWTLLTLLGVAAYLAGKAIAAHRFLGFYLPLPILAGLGLLALGRLVAGRWRSRSAGAVVVAAGLLVVTVIGWHDLYRTMARTRGVEWMTTPGVQQAATAQAYLRAVGVSDSAPAVVVVDDHGLNPRSTVPEWGYMMRSVLSPERTEHTYLYVGSPDNYLAAKPTYRTDPPSYNQNENEFWPAVRRVLPQHPTALLLKWFNPAYEQVAAAHPDWVVGPNVIALGGPVSSVTVAQPSVPGGPQTIALGFLYGTATLLILALAGLGWAIALLPPGTRSFEVLALSPAFGIAAIILAGVLVDAVGLRLGGAGGAVVILVAVLGGTIAGGVRLRRRGLETFPAA